jgi:pyruvate/2-oxoglutarate dehydrogenase complex dihydrolipoamide dehydrogenase (E3) component
VIATGSRPTVPDIPGLAESGYLDNVSIWSLEQLPQSLIVIGAGPSGLEFAQSFARLGSTVTVLADSPGVLPQEDPEASEAVARFLTAEGLTIKTGVQITKVEVRDGLKVCRFSEPGTDRFSEAAAAAILVAAGRLAAVEGLNLEAVGVHGDARHGIEVDEFLQTNAPRVFAIGDVLQRHQYTHAAEREAAVAFQNAVLRIRKKMDYTTLPRATFVDPEVAAVGITEAQARAEERDFRVFRANFAEIDRARIDGRPDGFAKVVTTPSGKILGATVVGEDASMILHEFVLAMERGLGLGDIASAVHIYPTYGGVARNLGNQFLATRLERGYVQTALRLFYGFSPRVAARNGAPAPDAVPSAVPAIEADEHGQGH